MLERDPATRRRQDRGGRLRLVVPDLDHRQPAGRQQSLQLRRQRAIGVETAGAREQRLRWFMLGDARPECRILGDVRRVAQNEIELLSDPLGPVAQTKVGARLEPEPAGIGAA